MEADWSRARRELEGLHGRAVETPLGHERGLAIGVGHHEREKHGTRPRGERHVEGRARFRQAERKREPPGEALGGARVLRRPESLDPPERVPLDQRGVGPPRARHQLTARLGRRPRHPGQPSLARADPLPEDAGDLVRRVERVGVVHVIEAEVVEVLPLPREVVGELVRRVLAVVAVIEEGREQLVKRAAHGGLRPPAMPEAREGSHAAEVGRGEDQEPAGAEDAEDLLQRVERVQVEVLEEFAKSTASTDRRGQGKGRLLDLAVADRDSLGAAALEELRPGAAALDGVVQPDDVPAARPRERREMARESSRRPGAAAPRPGAGAGACPGTVAGGTRDSPASQSGRRPRPKACTGVEKISSRSGGAVSSGAGARGACARLAVGLI